MVVGIAIGYPDWDDPIDQFPTEREPLDKVAKWYVLIEDGARRLDVKTL